MKHPIFHVDEEVRVGPQAYDRRMIGRACKITSVMKPICGEHRYSVRTPSGMCTIVLESTLQKVFERGRWSDPYGVWKPKREAR